MNVTKEIQERIKVVTTLVAQYESGKCLNKRDFEFVLNLLKYHPKAEEKIGTGVDKIRVLSHPMFKSSKFLQIERADGTHDDFSYRKCVAGKETVSDSDKIIKALRRAVHGFITGTRKELLEIDGHCSLCGKEVVGPKVHVDHVYPLTFEQLVNDFLIKENIVLKNIEIRAIKQPGQQGFLDMKLWNKWKKYHEENAKLRILCASCNMKQPRIKVDGKD